MSKYLVVATLVVVAAGCAFVGFGRDAPIRDARIPNDRVPNEHISASSGNAAKSNVDSGLDAESDHATDSPFSLSTAAEESPDAVTKSPPSQFVGPAVTTVPVVDAAAGDAAAYEIGQQSLSDADFRSTVQQLRSDAALLAATMDEFRSETDPQRLNRLAQLLGEVDSPELTPLASELIYSGNVNSQMAGLDLLRRIQPRDAGARDVVVNVLSSQSNPDVLVAALNVLATPGQVNAEQRQTMLNQITPLVNDVSPRVRQRALSTLSKWTNDASLTPTLLSGLTDPDPNVRQTAAYAFVNYPYPDADVSQALLTLLENSDNTKRARRGAALALHGMNLNNQEQQRLLIGERLLNRRSVVK